MGDLALGFEELGTAEPALAVAEIEECVDLARGEREQGGASAAARRCSVRATRHYRGPRWPLLGRDSRQGRATNGQDKGWACG